jgi:hypothetical protein
MGPGAFPLVSLLHSHSRRAKLTLKQQQGTRSASSVVIVHVQSGFKRVAQRSKCNHPSAVLMRSGSPQMHPCTSQPLAGFIPHGHLGSCASIGVPKSEYDLLYEEEESSVLPRDPVAEVINYGTFVSGPPYTGHLFTCLTRWLQETVSPNPVALDHQQSATRSSIWYVHLADHTSVMLCHTSSTVFRSSLPA